MLHQHALAHAVKISRMVGNEISLLHIVSNGISQKALAEARAQLQKAVDENSKKYNVILSWQISKGSIFTCHC